MPIAAPPETDNARRLHERLKHQADRAIADCERAAPGNAGDGVPVRWMNLSEAARA